MDIFILFISLGVLLVVLLAIFLIILGNWKNGKEKKIYSGMEVNDITKKEVKRDESNNQ